MYTNLYFYSLGGALEERANKRTKLANVDEASGVLINGESVVSGEVNDVDMGGDGKGAGKLFIYYVVDLVWFSLDCFLIFTPPSFILWINRERMWH